MDLSMKHLYQPIYQIKKGYIVGYEALLRSEILNGPAPDEMFRHAESSGKRPVLDRLSLLLAIKTYKGFEAPLFANIFADTLLETNFLSWWDKFIGKNDSLVLEIKECEKVFNWDKLKYVVKNLRSYGVKVAVDEMGTGFDSIIHSLELEPDYYKLNKIYVTDLVANPNKQRVIAHLLKIYRNSTEFVAVGIERQDDLDILKKLGVACVQGYVLSRPVPVELLTTVKENLEEIAPTLVKNTDDKYDNKRVHFRVELPESLCTEMTIALIKGRKVNIKSTKVCVRNISAGGLLFASGLMIPANKDIILGFEMEILGKTLSLQGNIVRTVIIHEGAYEYGVQFIIDENTRSEILKLLFDIQVIIRRKMSFSNTSICSHQCEMNPAVPV
jgi:EAL domain-containing protein (putative c-di-GMP-specific phosphodiesterase class I)